MYPLCHMSCYQLKLIFFIGIPAQQFSSTNLHSSLVLGCRSGLCLVVDLVVDLSISGVAVRPQRGQHGKTLLLSSFSFGVTQHVLAQPVWVATLEVQSEGDVAV